MKKRWREVERVDESEIVPNQHVSVTIVGREIEEKVPLKPLILTPPAKIVDNCLPPGCYRQFFRVHAPDIISKMKDKKLPVGTRCRSSFIPQWRVDNVRTNNMVSPLQKKRATCFYALYRSILKSAPDAVQYRKLGVFYLN